jgi:hypothetical protein
MAEGMRITGIELSEQTIMLKQRKDLGTLKCVNTNRMMFTQEIFVFTQP